MNQIEQRTPLRIVPPGGSVSPGAELLDLPEIDVPVDRPITPAAQLERRIARVLERHGDLVIASMSSERVTADQRAAFLRDLRTALALRADADISADFILATASFGLPRNGIRSITGGCRLAITSGDNRLAECRLGFDGTDEVEVTVPPASTILAAAPPAWLRALQAPRAAAPESRPLLNRELLATEISRIFRLHEDQVVRLITGDIDNPERHADHARLLASIRTTLGLRADAPLTLRFHPGTMTFGLPRRGLSCLSGSNRFSLSSGEQDICSGSLEFSGAPNVDTTIRADSPYVRAEPPAGLRALLRTDVPADRRAAIEELAERQRLARIHLPQGEHRSITRFLDDPGLEHLVSVFRELQLYARNERPGGRLLLTRLSRDSELNEGRIVELSTWVTRMLVADSLPPTPANIRACVSTLIDIHRTAADTPVFAGRRIVVAAGAEYLSEVRSFTDRVRLGHVTASHGDIHRFGTTEMIRRLGEESGGSVTLFRARAGARDRMESVLYCFSGRLGSLAVAPADRSAEDDRNVGVLATHVRRALGLAADADIRLQFTAARDGRSGTFRVFEGSDREPLFEATVSLARGQVERLTSASAYTMPDAQAPLSSTAVKTRVLEAIRTTPPGENGFTFIFTGHGLPGGLYLDGGAAGGSARITPRELADAILARRERFGERANRDVFMLLSCHSHEFLQEVGRLLGSSEASPYLYACTEFGQVGTESLGREIATPDFDEMLTRSRSLRRERDRGPFSVRDLLDLIMERNGLNEPNPSMFVPVRRPGQRERRYYQLSQAPAEGSPDLA